MCILNNSVYVLKIKSILLLGVLRVSDSVNMSKPNTLKAHRLSAEFAEKRGQSMKKTDPSNS